MTVDKIFESLGYKKYEYDTSFTNETPYFEWVNEEDDARESIKFDLASERVHIISTYHMHHVPSPLSLEEIKAIELQCKELGWKV